MGTNKAAELSDRAPAPTLASAGRVHFVGAGPGDPELLTLKARRLIGEADVIIYAGSLINPNVLAHARPGARLHNSVHLSLEAQIALMEEAVNGGQTVVRLHSGDPSVYGAIAEQMWQLRRLGIAYDLLPGVSSASAAAATLGIEYTAPGSTQTLILSRLAGRTAVPQSENLRDLAAHRSSLVLFLSAGMVEAVVAELRLAGYADDTPVAVVERASWPDERVLRGTLADIADQVQAAEITHQALIIISPALAGPATDNGPTRSHLYSRTSGMTERDGSFAIIALTRRGTETGATLHSRLPNSILYAPARFLGRTDGGDGTTVGFEVSARQVLQEAFAKHRGLVCIMAAGIVVRGLAAVLESKYDDPGVVVLDELGRHAVSLLAGHRGRANDLARLVAALMAGEAVITTASDLQELPTLETLGAECGWRLERAWTMNSVISAMVNGETLAIYQDAGDECWLARLASAQVSRCHSWQDLVAARPKAAIVVSHRHCPNEVLAAIPNTIIYRPPCLVVGIGCNRGTGADEIIAAVKTALAEAGLAEASVALVATIDAKAAEFGLVEACRRQGWLLHSFTSEQIAAIGNLPNPSPYAERALGVKGVAEPCALLGARTNVLLVEKRKCGNVTVAVARGDRLQEIGDGR